MKPNDDDEDDVSSIKLWDVIQPENNPPPLHKAVTPGVQAEVTTNKGNGKKIIQAKSHIKPENKPALKKSRFDFTGVGEHPTRSENRIKLAEVRKVVKASRKETGDKVSRGVEDGLPYSKSNHKHHKDKIGLGVPTLSEWETHLPSKDESEDQIIKDLLPHSPGAFGIIAGRTGLGKTNLLLNIAHSLATGSKFIDLPCKKVGVAMLAFEGDFYNLKERANKIRHSFITGNDKLNFDLLHFNLLRFSGKSPVQKCAEVFSMLKDTENITVAILDPVKYLVPGDYLNPKDVAAFTNTFAELLARYKLTAIVTLPIHKPQNKNCLINVNDVYSIKGATEWVDPATFCILIEKRSHYKGIGEVVMGFVKRRNNDDNSPDNFSIRFDKETCTFEKIKAATNYDADGNLIVEVT